MQRIDHYRFMAKGTTDHLKGQVHPDLHKGVLKTAKQIMAYLDGYGAARSKIKANLSLSATGQKEQIEAIATDAYKIIHKMREQSDYRGNIRQLNKRIDQLAPKHSTEEKLLRQLQMAEIRQHLAGKDQISIYSDATKSGDMMTAQAIEEAPGFMLDPLLPPIIEAELEKRRAETDPSLTGQIHELEKCDSATRLLFTDAELLLGGETDIISDIVNTEIAMEATAE